MTLIILSKAYTLLDFQQPIFLIVSTEKPNSRRSDAMPAQNECVEYKMESKPHFFSMTFNESHMCHGLMGLLLLKTKNGSKIFEQVGLALR